MIHVCFGLYDKTGRYSKFTGTTICSIFENTSANVTVHILHDNTLTQDNREKFIYLAGQYNQHVNFYNVEELCAEKLTEMVSLVPAVKTARVSVGAFYRLLSPQILSTNIDKCIYLDSDVIVNMDISELWQIDLGGKVLAAAPEEKISYLDHPIHAKKKFLLYESIVGYADYFNSGVLLMNSKYLRNAAELIMSGVKWRGEHTQCDCFDQDILNYLFSKNYVKLAEKFDIIVGHERRRQNEPYKLYRAIYHYGDSPHGAGMGLNINDPFNQLWMDYFIKTPWFDAQTIGKLYAGFRQMHVGLKNSMIQISALMSGKTRAFFITPSNRDAFKKIFSIRDDEKIILAENNESLKKLLDAMKNSRGKKVFFILLPNFPFNVLTQVGFVAGRDFVNGSDFLSEAHGVPLNSYPLLKAM